MRLQKFEFLNNDEYLLRRMLYGMSRFHLFSSFKRLPLSIMEVFSRFQSRRGAKAMYVLQTLRSFEPLSGVLYLEEVHRYSNAALDKFSISM